MDKQQALLAELQSELEQYEKHLSELDIKEVRIMREGVDVKAKLIADLKASVAHREGEIGKLKYQMAATAARKHVIP